ncbi:ABC transporter permease [Agrococcus carbonis]|uniref:Putative ABC transport system permease protein n=1 Tax=Agrococcus carbonis TaxID=684552 RepID=A0A1H1L2C5_9MICO|nr:ABC transporter permease [Agrococcus carbonis]SDR68460.1 putative ABC transport system permease protein [Agrococcus carbonis]
MTAVAAPAAPAARARRADGATRTGQGLAFAVSVLAAAFGTGLATLMEHAARALYGEAMLASSPTARIMLAIAGVLLIGVSVVVGAIVARQAFTGAVEDLRSEIALRRLLGASARVERGRVLRGFVLVGATGAAVGWLAGVLLAAGAGAVVSRLADRMDFAGMPAVEPWAVVPAAAVAAAAALSAVLATRGVLAVSPLEALRGAGVDVETTRPRRRVGGIVTLAIGALLLAASVALSVLSPLAVLVGFAGGVVSVVGIIVLAPAIVPPLTAVAVRALGRGVPARAAAGTLATHPGRTSALVLSLFAGAAVVTMMMTAGSSLTTAVVTMERSPEFRAELQAIYGGVTTVITGIVGFSAVLAVLGFVAAMLLSVRRRAREIGLLRMLGMRRRQTRAMLVAEAGVITAVAVSTGFGMGVLYGWIGTQSMVGSIGGVVSTAPVVPWALPVALVIGGVVVALAASLPAGHRAASVPPLAAVAAD